MKSNSLNHWRKQIPSNSLWPLNAASDHSTLVWLGSESPQLGVIKQLGVEFSILEGSLSDDISAGLFKDSDIF